MATLKILPLRHTYICDKAKLLLCKNAFVIQNANIYEVQLHIPMYRIGKKMSTS
jgi:hypothetical protein